MDLAGLYPALTTPFAPDGSVSIADIKHNIARYNATGLRGYVAMGSTGESVLLSHAEWETVLVAVKEAAAPGKRLIAGTGAESTAETIEKTKRAAQLGYEVALVKTPHYYKPAYKPEVFIAHYRRVADASPIPILLYSVPVFTGITLEAPEIGVLAQHPNIIGIKDSSGVVLRASETLAVVPLDFNLLVGSPATLLASVTVGAKGGILALASALPELCVQLFDLARRGPLDEARVLQTTLLKASAAVVSEAGIAGIKFVMDQRGLRGGIPRLPLLAPSEPAKRRMLEMLATLEPAAAPARA
jgi:4-hydroxy-2-oxoglutarate aldolase